jgi:hypothetical protein
MTLFPKVLSELSMARKSKKQVVAEHEAKYYTLYPDPENSFGFSGAAEGPEAAIKTVIEHHYVVNPADYGSDDLPSAPDLTGDASLWLAGRLVALFLMGPDGRPRVIRF